jgi:outer membrane lipoprotein-sorting protein
MTEDVLRLVSQIRERTKLVVSFTADYRSIYHSGVLPFEASGRTYFLRPDRIRSETTVNGKSLVSIRNGSIIRRYSPTGTEVWQYDLKSLPETQPLNFGIADITDPFFAVDVATLQYGGPQDTMKHAFTGMTRVPTTAGLLDTRKGFVLPYKPKAPQIQVRLLVDVETGLLLEIVGTDKAGSESFKAQFGPHEINCHLDESLFEIEESKSGYRIIEIKDILTAALDPDYADQPPSLN